MAVETESDKEMNLVAHLAELRNRLIVTAVFFIVFFVGAFIYVKEIYSFFEKDMDFVLNVTSPAEIIWVYLTMAGLAALVGTLPILALQVWLFIKPALTVPERRASLSYVPAVFILFVLGLTFGYIAFSKLILPFLLALNDGMFNELFTVEKYFRFMLRVTLPFAILFEIPIIAMFLTSLGILTPTFMRKTRKYAYFILLIVGAFVTPPDIVLQLVVAIPLFILYEISIYLSTIVYRKKEKKRKAYLNEDQSE
ncbi:MAG TPA: twin-arginine translocase subunit TatC [Virgibacillus sp.]|nr:twin-arginine translocase subunit TatC [Virgibacillus sp.]